MPMSGCDGDFLHSRHAGEATLLELVMYGFLDPKRRYGNGLGMGLGPGIRTSVGGLRWPSEGCAVSRSVFS